MSSMISGGGETMNKTAIRDIEKWCRRRTKARRNNCPFDQADSYGRDYPKDAIQQRNYERRGQLCHEVFPDMQIRSMPPEINPNTIPGCYLKNCPCDTYRDRLVAKRAKEFTKAWRSKRGNND